MIVMAEENKNVNLDKELETLYQPKQAPQKRAGARKSAAPKKKAVGKSTTKKKLVMAKGKRKEAIARATLVQGSGRVLINGSDIKFMRPEFLRELIMEPIKISEKAMEIASDSDISINVYGGGRSGQAQAARSAIGKALAEAASGDSLRKLYMDYDRTILVDDYRRVEPKKFLGPKARAKFQKSYR